MNYYDTGIPVFNKHTTFHYEAKFGYAKALDELRKRASKRVYKHTIWLTVFCEEKLQNCWK